jgi:DNA-binding transcriptional LysR family regulator
VVAEGYDIGIRLGEYVSPTTVAFPIGPPLRQIAVASPDYITKHGRVTHPRDLTQHQCINWRQQPSSPPYVWEFAKGAEQVAVAVNGPLWINDRAVAVNAAVAGLGIALWVEHRLKPLILSGVLRPLLEDWSAPYPGFYAYYYRDRHMNAATRAVIGFMRARANVLLGANQEQ